MKRFFLLTILGLSFYFLNAQDIIYTITGKINQQTTSIDSILVENISNNTRILFGNLPDLPDYNINITQKAFWGATGIGTFKKDKGFYIKSNYPGMIVLICDYNRPLLADVTVYNTNGQKIYGFQKREISPGSSVNIHLNRAGLYIVKLVTQFGIQTFKAIGSSHQKNDNIFVNITSQHGFVHGFKSTTVATDDGFSFNTGDSIRISIFKKNYYAYPAVLKITKPQSLIFTFDKSTADSTGVSDVYVNLSDTSTTAKVMDYDTLDGKVQIKYSGQKPDIKTGDIVTVDLDTVGYLRKVVSTTTKDSTITVTTTQAYLNDIFVNKDIKLNTRLIQPKTTLKSTSTYQQIATALTDNKGYIHPVEIIYHDKNGKLKTENVLKNNHLKDGKINIIDFYRDIARDLYGKAGDNVHFYIKEGHVALTSDAVFEFDYKDAGSLSRDSKAKKGSLKSFKYYLDSRADFLAKLALDLQQKYEKEKTKRLTHIPKATAKFIVPPGIPVWITFSCDLYGRFYFESDASMHADWGFESTQTLKIGGTYTKATNEFTPIKEYTPKNTVFPLNLSGEINDTARLEIYPRVDVKFYGFFGPYAEIVPYLAGNYHAKWQSQVTSNGSHNFLTWNSGLNLGLDFRVGTELTFVGLYKKDYGPITANCFDKVLWSSPKNIELLTSLPENVDKGTKINLTYKVTDLLDNPVLGCPVYISGNGSFDHQLVSSNAKGDVSIQWTLNNPGNNKITALIYKTDKSVIDQTSSTVNVNTPPALTSDFSATPTSGTAPLTVTFTDKSTGNPTSWQWDFGDGNTSTEQNPSYTYNSAGTYTVKLTVSNDNGSDTKTQNDYIKVSSSGGGSGSTGTFTDPRDGQTYKTVKIGNQTWMAENLNYKTDNSWCYNNDPSNCDVYGRLYNWNTIMNGSSSSNSVPSGVQGICPDGWHIPSDAEWDILVNYLGGKNVAGGKMKEVGTIYWDSPNTGATNESGFTALPGGQGNDEENFYDLHKLGFWWSSTTEQSLPNDAWKRILFNDNNGVNRSGGGKLRTFSVRCVKNGNSLVADFSAIPTSGTVPLTVTFTDKSTGNPTSWQWDFGDGNTSTEQNPSHTYNSAGTYTVKLTVSNSDGSATKTQNDYIKVSSSSGGSGSTGTFTDPRDGQTYKTVKIGNQTWMAENLNYKTDNSWWYNNDESNGDIYGRLYTWDAAKIACPDGWHLPSDDEWDILENYLGGKNVAGGKMKEVGTTYWDSPNAGATNESGFSALPGGYRRYDNDFYSLNYYGNWWSATEDGSDNAWYRTLYYNFDWVGRDIYYKGDGFSVRCLKN